MNIADLIQDTFPEQLPAQLVLATGVPESRISPLLSAAIPALVQLLIRRAAEQPEQTAQLLQRRAATLYLYQSEENDPAFPEDMARLLGTEEEALRHQLASYAAVPEAAVATISKSLAAYLMGTIGHYAQSHQLSATDLASWLTRQEAQVQAMIPSGFSDTDTATPPSTATVYKERNRWLVPLVLVSAVAGLVCWLSRNGGQHSTSMTTTTFIEATDDAPTVHTSYTDTAGNTIFHLPDGTILSVITEGAMAQLLTQLHADQASHAAAHSPADTSWINLDQLYFESGTTGLMTASQGQFDQLIAILKAYPERQFKLRVYTDTKDDAQTLALARERAEKLQTILISAGVGSGQIYAAASGRAEASNGLSAPVAAICLIR